MHGQLRDLIPGMSTDKHRSGLERAAIIKAFQEMSDELGGAASPASCVCSR